MILVDEAACPGKGADEAEIVATHVRGLVDSGVPQGDIAILLRAMTNADTFAGALRDAGLEVFVASGGTYFDSPEVVDLEMLLRVAANTHDDEALLHVLCGPMTALSPDALGRVRRAVGKGRPLWSACDVESLNLDAGDARSLMRTVEGIEWLRHRSGRTGLADLIHEVCEMLEYDLTLFARGYAGVRAWSNVLKLARIAGDFESGSPGDPGVFLEYLRLKREIEGRESLAAFAVEGIDAVRIMSIHAAKGLEFPVTVVADLGRGTPAPGGIVLSTGGGRAFLGMKLPACEQTDESIRTLGYEMAVSAESDAGLAEAKRLFYVACTRARDALVLSGRTAFDREADSARPVGWIRQILGLAAAGSIVEGDRRIGSALVRVLTPQPGRCGSVGTARPRVQEHTLALAASERSVAESEREVGIERISYTGLARYRACPYRFYVTSIARLGPGHPRDTDGHDPSALGNAVHAVLRTASGTELPPSWRIEELCRSAQLPEPDWSRVARLSQAFLDSETAARVRGCARVHREMPFAVPIEGVLLDGAVDLIAWDADAAIVVDYKTGRPTEGGDHAAYRAQAGCYALAAFAMGAARVEVRIVELNSEGSAIVFDFDRVLEPELRSEVSATIASIVSGQFDPLDRYDGFVCPECPAYGNLCPISGPGQKHAG